MLHHTRVFWTTFSWWRVVCGELSSNIVSSVWGIQTFPVSMSQPPNTRYCVPSLFPFWCGVLDLTDALKFEWEQIPAADSNLWWKEEEWRLLYQHTVAHDFRMACSAMTYGFYILVYVWPCGVH